MLLTIALFQLHTVLRNFLEQIFDLILIILLQIIFQAVDTALVVHQETSTIMRRTHEKGMTEIPEEDGTVVEMETGDVCVDVVEVVVILFLMV